MTAIPENALRALLVDRRTVHDFDDLVCRRCGFRGPGQGREQVGRLPANALRLLPGNALTVPTVSIDCVAARGLSNRYRIAIDDAVANQRWTGRAELLWSLYDGGWTQIVHGPNAGPSLVFVYEWAKFVIGRWLVWYLEYGLNRTNAQQFMSFTGRIFYHPISALFSSLQKICEMPSAAETERLIGLQQEARRRAQDQDTSIEIRSSANYLEQVMSDRFNIWAASWSSHVPISVEQEKQLIRRILRREIVAEIAHPRFEICSVRKNAEDLVWVRGVIERAGIVAGRWERSPLPNTDVDAANGSQLDILNRYVEEVSRETWLPRSVLDPRGTARDIRTAVGELVGDESAVLVVENPTGETDQNGRPPHSVEVVVDDRFISVADHEVARVINGQLPAGVATTGNITAQAGADHPCSPAVRRQIEFTRISQLTPTQVVDRVIDKENHYIWSYWTGGDETITWVNPLIRANSRVVVVRSGTGTHVRVSLGVAEITRGVGVSGWTRYFTAWIEPDEFGPSSEEIFNDHQAVINIHNESRDPLNRAIARELAHELRSRLDHVHERPTDGPPVVCEAPGGVDLDDVAARELEGVGVGLVGPGEARPDPGGRGALDLVGGGGRELEGRREHRSDDEGRRWGLGDVGGISVWEQSVHEPQEVRERPPRPEDEDLGLDE